MYTHTAAFDAEVSRSHHMVARADLLQGGVVVQTLNITDGDVTISDDPVRRRCTIRMQDPTGALVPKDFGDLLTPGAAEVKLWRGVQYANGTQELLPLGVFGISKYRLDDSGQSMSVSLDGFDRARRVQRAVFPTDYVIIPGQNYVSAIKNMLQIRYPAIVFGFVATTTHTTPLIVLQAGKDPWGEAHRLLGNIGYDIYFDPDGFCTIVIVDSPSASSVANLTLAEGTNCTLLSLTKSMSDEGFFNHVVVTGESSQSSATSRAEVKDNNPSSPTYVGGPMGDVVDFFTSSTITSTALASATAKARLNKSLGIPITVETQDIVHPALDINDLLQITRVRSNINDLYVASKISMPLTQDRSMNVATRQRLLGV